VDVRVVAATNHELRARIAAGQFREDLYYRLSMVEIRTPALADRKEDLPLLERYLIQKYAAQYRRPVTALAPRAQILLARHFWPGNVRELENVIGHACMIAGEIIDIADLPLYMREGARQKAAAVIAFPGRKPETDRTELSFDEQERQVLERALGRVAGNQVHAARLLGISRDKLRYKIKKHNLL